MRNRDELNIYLFSFFKTKNVVERAKPGADFFFHLPKTRPKLMKIGPDVNKQGRKLILFHRKRLIQHIYSIL